MIILCTGMMRSGSSWSYNAVRLLMKENSPKIASGYADDIGRALAEARDADHVIIKTHKPDGLGRALIRHHACRIVHSFRQPIETMASMMQSYDGDFDRQLTAIEAGFDILRFELDCGGVHFIWYDEILHHSTRRVQALAEYLGLDVPDAVIGKIAHNLSREVMIKATANLPATDRRQPIGRFLWTNKDALSKGLIRNAPKPADKILNTAQRKWLSEKMAGLVDDKGELLDLVKNIGCIATYYHQGQVVAEGASPPVIQAPVAPPPMAETALPKKSAKPVASVGDAVSLSPPPLSESTLSAPPMTPLTGIAPTGLALSAISQPPPPSGMAIKTALT
ncbi:MAG: hypothetical protein ORN98_10145, partial [Alphaproteobacteria bacterium]|nr:hypothetical protein [Alphaproteobacteria bacterium]